MLHRTPGLLGRLCGHYSFPSISVVDRRRALWMDPWSSIIAKRRLFGNFSKVGHPIRGDPQRLWNSSTQGEWRSTVKQLRREVKNAENSQMQKELLQGSRKVVGLAILSNGVMFTGKLVAAVQSGSASLFSEALHSLADIFNECLLMLGIWRSLRAPDLMHPYGFNSERYAWALVSGVGIFFLGGGVSLYHGISGLLDPHQLGDLTYAIYALGGSLMFESITLTYAYKHISKSAAVAGISFWEYLKKGADPTSVQVFLEDCAAITGVLIASTCLAISHFLSLPMFDSIGSILIGALLSSVASFLIKRNVAGLVETSMSARHQSEIVQILQSDPVVRSVHDVKSTALGPEFARFKAEILFDGEEITRRYLARQPHVVKELKKLQLGETKELESFLVRQGGQIISSLGSEVDRLEQKVTDRRPEVKHIDLEIL